MKESSTHRVYELPLRKGGGFYVENAKTGQDLYYAGTFTEVIAWLEAAGVDFTLYRYMDDKDAEYCGEHLRYTCPEHVAASNVSQH